MESEISIWGTAGNVATAVATALALFLLFRDMWHRAKEKEKEQKQAIDDYNVKLLEQLQRTFLGRFNVSGQRIPEKTAEEMAAQYRLEVQVQGIVDLLPPEYTAFIRVGEEMTGKYWPTKDEWDNLILPWKDHPLYKSGLGQREELKWLDIQSTIRAIRTGSPKLFPIEYRSTVNSDAHTS